jgi:hypothetical protein
MFLQSFGLCVKDLTPAWCYWKVVEPLKGGLNGTNFRSIPLKEILGLQPLVVSLFASYHHEVCSFLCAMLLHHDVLLGAGPKAGKPTIN